MLSKLRWHKQKLQILHRGNFTLSNKNIRILGLKILMGGVKLPLPLYNYILTYNRSIKILMTYLVNTISLPPKQIVIIQIEYSKDYDFINAM